jgi:hypothetical protein
MTTKSRIEKLEKCSRRAGTKHLFVYYKDRGMEKALADFKARYPDDQNRIIFNVVYEEKPIKDDRARPAAHSLVYPEVAL